MQQLFRYSQNRIAETETGFLRYLYDKVDWNHRLVGITGARGIGKTTLLLQYMKNTFANSPEALYVSLDNFYFLKNRLFDIAEDFYTNGGRALFIDEVHRYPDWSLEIKNLYDNFPQLKLVFSGSSALQIYKAEADLSRRAALYKMNALSLREYIALTKGIRFNTYTLSDILNNHSDISMEIKQIIQPVPLFKEYLKGGAYPFFIESPAKFTERLISTINVIIEVDLMSIENFTYSTLVKLRRILAFIADSVPFKPNISELSRKTGVARDILLRMIDLLERADLLLLLREDSTPTGYLTKPEKIYLNNTALFYALASNQQPEIGTLRETFFASQLSNGHRINTTAMADFLVDGQYVFEIGGKNKKSRQIQDLPNAYVVSDDIEIGFRNQIPLWLFGFLY